MDCLELVVRIRVPVVSVADAARVALEFGYEADPLHVSLGERVIADGFQVRRAMSELASGN